MGLRAFPSTPLTLLLRMSRANVRDARNMHDDAGSISGGGTTVFGDSFAGPNIKDYDLVSATGKGKTPIAHGIPLEATPDRATKFGSGSGDYKPKNSSLFVRIGDDGVLPALYKLNGRLKSVSLILFSRTRLILNAVVLGVQ